MAPKKIHVTLDVNGTEREMLTTSTQTLLEALRDQFELGGTKRGCNQGTCGSCTVLVDGEPACACLLLAVGATGRRVTTIEGLAENGKPSVVQQAFLDAGAIQCGFCMAGMIVAATALLVRERKPSIDRIREAVSGNLCRCSGYVKVIDAVLLASKRLAA